MILTEITINFLGDITALCLIFFEEVLSFRTAKIFLGEMM